MKSFKYKLIELSYIPRAGLKTIPAGNEPVVQENVCEMTKELNVIDGEISFMGNARKDVQRF